MDNVTEDTENSLNDANIYLRNPHNPFQTFILRSVV